MLLEAGPDPQPKQSSTKLEAGPGALKSGAIPMAPLNPLWQPTESGRLSKNYIAQSDLENYMAGNQSGLELFGKAGAQTVSEAILGTVEAASYLGDWQQAWDKLHGDEKEYTNWLADAMKEAKGGVQDATKVFQTAEDRESGFNPGSWTWWAANSPQAIGSTISLLLPAAGVAGMAAKGMKLLGAGQKAVALGRGLSATLASRYAENTMEANNVYEQALSKGATPEAAGQQASNVWNTNWAFALQDFAQYMTLMKGFGSLAKGKKGLSIAELLSTPVTEAAEEAGQFIVSQEGINAAVDTNVDYFGKGFQTRLRDYLQDPELKSSALLGAMGGTVFAGAGKVAELVNDKGEAIAGKAAGGVNWVKDQIGRLTKQGLQKERANYAGDTGTSTYIDNVAFGQLVMDATDKGTLPKLQQDLEELTKSEGIAPEARESLSKRKEDVEFLLAEQGRLKSGSAPSQLHVPIMMAKLESRQLARMEETLSKEIEHLQGEAVKNKEIPMELLDIKKLQISAEAYARLAQTNPALAPKAEAAMRAFKESLANPTLSIPFPDIDKALTTTVDSSLFEKAFQLASVAEKSRLVKDDLYKLTTPQGQAEKLKEEAIRTADKQVDALLSDPRTTKQQLEEALTKNPSPASLEKINQKLADLVEKNSAENKASVSDALGQETSLPMENPDVDFEDQFDFENDTPIPDDTELTEQLSKWLAPEDVDATVSRMTLETPKEAEKPSTDSLEKIISSMQKAKDLSTVATRLKVISGHWEDVKGKQVFIAERDADGIEVPQPYTDNRTGKRVAVEDVFETDPASGRLYADTPLLKEGDTVILKVENDFPYTLTPGFKPTGVDNYVINVYRSSKDGKAIGKPLTQLPSADSPGENEPATLIHLRMSVIQAKDQRLVSNVVSKNVGSVRNSPNSHSLSIFSHDYVKEGDTFKYKKIPTNPILALAKLNGELVVPNAGAMKGMTPEALEQIEDLKVLPRGTDPSRGSRYVLRTNPVGNLQLVQVQGRKMSEQEIAWTKKNIAQYIKDGDLDTLAEVFYVEKNGVGLFKTKSDGRDITRKSGKQFIVIETVKGKRDMLVAIGGGEWISVDPANLQQLSNSQDFLFRRVAKDGTWPNDVFSSTKTEPSEIGRITEAYNAVIGNAFRNMREDRLNSELPYVDLVTGQAYGSYYDFVVGTETATARVPGSPTIGHGEDSSYSFHNVGVRLNATVNPITVEQKHDQDTDIIIEDKQDVPVPEAPKPQAEDPVGDYYDQKLRPYAVTEGFKVVGQRELDWFDRHIGPDSRSIVEDVDRIIAKSGVEAFGLYHKALVRVAQFAEVGTTYHEAFHLLIDPQLGLITERQRNKVLEGTTEEQLAEDFRLYMLSGGKMKQKPAPTNLFKRIYEAIKRILGLRTPIENLFREIASTELTAQQRDFLNKVRTGEVFTEESEEQTRLLPGFRRYAQQIEAVNVSAYQIMNYIWNVSRDTGLSVGELLTAKADASGESVLDECFKLLKSKYLKDYQRIHAIPRSARSQEDYIRHDSYLSMGVADVIENADPQDNAAHGKWDDMPTDLQVETGFKTEVIKAFAQFGFRIQLKDGTIYSQVGTGEGEQALATGESTAEVEEITEEISKDEVHGIDVTMKDPVKSLSQKLKLFLASIPDPNYKSVYGLPTPIDFNKVFTILSYKLSDTRVPAAELAEIYKGDPILTAIFNRIGEELRDGDQSLVNEFNTRFNLTETHFVSFIEEYSGAESTLKMIDTNRNSADRAILALWRDNLASKGLLKRSGDVNIATATIFLAKIQKLKEEFQASKQAKNSLPYSRLKEEMNLILGEMGITLPEQLWAELEDSKANTRTTTVANWLFGKQRNSLENLFQNMKDNGVLEGTTVLDILARRARNYMDVGGGDTFLDEKNNQRYPINLPSALSDMINNIKQNGAEVAKYYEQDKFYESNEFVKLMKDPIAVDELRIMNPSAYRRGQTDPRDFEDRTQADSMITRFGAFHNNGSVSFAVIYVGTHEAKQKQSLIPLKKYNTADEARTFLTQVMKGTVDSEIVRIQRLNEAKGLVRGEGQPSVMDSNPLPTEIKDFSERGGQFLYIPALNTVKGLADKLGGGTISQDEFTKALAERDRIIQEFIDDQYQSFLEQLDRLGVIKLEVKDGANIVKNELIPESVFKGKLTDTFLKEFFYNDFAWRHELSKVFNGDIAFYKSDDDYYKRGYQTVTPGTKPYTDPAAPTTLVTAISPAMPKINTFEYLASLAQIVDSSVTAQEIEDHIYHNKKSKKSIVDKIADFHSIKNGADSQTMITVGAWKKIMESLGDWTKGHELLYQFAWSKDLTVNQAINQAGMSPEEAKNWRKLAIETATQPLKPFQFSERMITLVNGEKMIVKEQYKDSRAALNPEFVLRHPGYKKLLSYMRENGIEVMVNADAVKVGSYGIVDFNKPVEQWQKRVNNLNDLRLPQLNSNAVKEEASGSQFHKLILGNVERKGKYSIPEVGERTGQYVVEEYGDLWSQVHERDSKALKKKLGFSGSFELAKGIPERKKQMFKIKTILEQELMSRNLNENYSDAVKLVLDEMNQPRFNVSIAFPNYSARFVGVLNNMFKKTFLNPKSPGFVGVDMADFATGQEASSDLQFIQNKGGEVVEAEIGMPVSFFNKIGLNFREYVDPKTNKIIWDKLDANQRKALQGILYRIPTSNKSSAIPIRIAMVIHPSQGQVVMVPPEFLTQQGLDFDYDKSQIIMRVLDKKGQVDQESPETKIFNLAWSILTSPQHLEEVLTALTSKRLKEISDVFKSKEATRWMSPMNPARDVIAEDQNRDAKRMIGIFSRGNTAHAMLQTIKDYVSVSSSFGINIETSNGYKLNTLGEVYDSSGKLISENFGEYQSAALDSGKDPILYYLSTNKTTAPAVVRMLLSGTSQELLNNFINQPAIKEWMRELQRTGGSNTENAFNSLFEKYPGLRTKYTDFNTGKITMKLTEGGLIKSLDVNVQDNLDVSARVLSEFAKILNTPRTISKLTSILSVDTFNDMTGPESLEAFVNQALDLVDPEGEVYVDPRIFDLEKAPREAKRLASFFKHAIADALQFVGQFYPYMNQSYVQVKQELASTLGVQSLVNKKTIKNLNQFLDFYIMDTNALIAPVLNKLAPDPRVRWTYSSPENSMFAYVEDMIRKYPALTKNKLINGIRTSYSKVGGVQMVGLANSNNRINKTELTKAWRDMMLNANGEIKTLAYDLVRFSIYTSGFGFNTRSFVDLIPNDFWVENGIADAHYKALSGLLPSFGQEATTRLDAEAASRSFVRHNFRQMDEVPEVYVRWTQAGIQSQLTNVVANTEDKHIQSFTIPSDSALRKRGNIGNFVKIRASVIVNNKKIDEFRLYEANPEEYTSFREVQPLGEDRAYFEVDATGRNQSRVPLNDFHGSPDPWGTIPIKKIEPPKSEGSSEIPECAK